MNAEILEQKHKSGEVHTKRMDFVVLSLARRSVTDSIALLCVRERMYNTPHTTTHSWPSWDVCWHVIIINNLINNNLNSCVCLTFGSCGR